MVFTVRLSTVHMTLKKGIMTKSLAWGVGQ